MQENFVKYKES